MRPSEQGFLLMTSHLGDPQRPVLTVVQMRVLTECVRTGMTHTEDRSIVPEDLMALGYNRPSAERIIQLLSEQERLQRYLERGALAGCEPISRITRDYPLTLRKRLSLNSPGCLWLKGDRSLLGRPAVALVGSRDLCPANAEFAREVGKQAALQGYVLVSGNARGADTVAQESCLAHGGSVISVVADSLLEHSCRDRVLYISEDSFDLPFSTARALSRNRLIHAMGVLTFVAQCRPEHGGTWSGTINNLKEHWTPLFCYADGSEGANMLLSRGVTPVTYEQLADLDILQSNSLNFFDL